MSRGYGGPKKGIVEIGSGLIDFCDDCRNIFLHRFFGYVTLTLATQVTCNSLSTTMFCTETAHFVTLQASGFNNHLISSNCNSKVRLRGGL